MFANGNVDIVIHAPANPVIPVDRPLIAPLPLLPIRPTSIASAFTLVGIAMAIAHLVREQRRLVTVPAGPALPIAQAQALLAPHMTPLKSVLRPVAPVPTAMEVELGNGVPRVGLELVTAKPKELFPPYL